MKKTSPLPSPSLPRPAHSSNTTSAARPHSHPHPPYDPSNNGSSRPQLRRNSRKSSDEKIVKAVVPPPSRPSPERRSAEYLGHSDTSTSTETTEEEDNVLEADTSALQLERDTASSPEAIEIERLRQAVHAKILANQERALANLSPKGSPGGKTPGSIGARRVSPIKEESTAKSPSMSPSIHASFGSPLAISGPETASTESTESARTIRGSVPPTPSHQLPLRTPSYPFPYVPGTPRIWSSSFHQPFTALSPTAASLQHRSSQTTSRETVHSGHSTPGSISTFLPGASPHQENEDPRFPAPNMFDCILLLNSEPGLDTWWSTVVKLAHEWFGAERASLSVPADFSDVENVPWAQKATFNASGRTDASSQGQDSIYVKSRSGRTEPWSRSDDEQDEDEDTVGNLAIGLGRPKLETRHSFAGHERQKDVVDAHKTSFRLERPAGPPRTASHVPRTLTRGSHPLRHMSPVSYDGASPSSFRQNTKESTFSDPEFSSMGDAGPYVSLFDTMKPLSDEDDPLIDNGGITRILERGRLVTLTRDYTAASSSSGSSISRGRTNVASENKRHFEPKGQARFQHKSTTSHQEYGQVKRTSSYEEYEQFPASPWAQSPAPSPAIQHDASENPFFASKGAVDEDSFNPSGSFDDYTKPVEAIGVDRASTITHIPLIHPVLSQILQPSGEEVVSESRKGHDPLIDQNPQSPSNNMRRTERRAPIAVISILSSAVPFPQNWTSFLRNIAPHLATSFSNANQFTSMQKQAANSRRGLFAANETSLEPGVGGLSGLMRLEFDPYPGASAPGSMTSPSDYSGRSRPSPGGSMLGTPGWDPAMAGFTRTSVTSTPAHISGSEAVDSYFDTKKKIMGAKTGSHAHQSVVPKSPSELRTTAKKAAQPSPVDTDDVVTPKTTVLKPTSQTRSRDTSSSSGNARDFEHGPSPRRPHFRPTASHLNDPTCKNHSQLHSYGADFSSTFQSLPAATTPRTPGGIPHNRSGSSSDQSDMLPPSTNLLRTIIDSLPVQIFTAAPVTGVLTWVNSKFLVYRGQDVKQVLQEPWQAIHPDDREEYLNLWSKSLRTGQQLAYKLRLQRFDGNYRWFYLRAAPLKDKRQNIVHWIGTNMDFHDQHLAELNAARQQETAASEAKYRALANSSPQIVFAATRLKGVIFCNSQWVLFSGQTETEATGLGFMDFVHPEDMEKCRLPTLEPDGSAVIDAPISVPDELRQSTSSSEFSENSSETERFVSSPTEVGSPSATGMPQVKLARLASTGILKISKDIDGRPSYSTEVRLRSKDGAYRWHLVRVLLTAPVVATGQEEDTWYGTCTDINDHKLLEQTLKETMDAKSRFLSNMSHEIRTPLNGITGMVNFLIDSSLTAEQMEHVNIIRSSTEGLRDLINDILDLSKVEAGMITLNPHWFTVRELIEDVNDLTSGMAVDKGLDLNYVLEDNVPCDVKGDKFRIRQVLLNVIGNAIKFTEVGEVFVRCHVAEQQTDCKEDEMLLQFQIIDTGKGFTEKEAEYLFKRFSQIDQSSTRQHGGTGLGLAISMQLVELHGGKMKASSIPGKGSTFTFSIKFNLPTPDDRPETSTLSPGTGNTSYNLPTPYATDGPPGIEKRFSSMYGSPGRQVVESPALSEVSHGSPGPASSASSDPSIRTVESVRSNRSSISSFVPENQPMKLSLPGKTVVSRGSGDSTKQVRPTMINVIQPPMYSVLVVCPLEYSREAIGKHVATVLPQSVPNQITARADLADCMNLLGGDDPVRFTHVVVNLRSPAEIIMLLSRVFRAPEHATTAVVVMTDLAQKRAIMKDAVDLNFDSLTQLRRLLFVFKPLKPSKIAAFFNPRSERDITGDRSYDSAQQAVMDQKQVFDDSKRRLGNRGLRVLLVEDNKINQTVLLKFLSKIAIDVETVLDGVQCTDKVFAQTHGYYSIILCDLHMPNKDGYQTCREIRKWEKHNKYPHLPIVALSANVLGDVYAKCVEAGFNSYVTKPVEFKVLAHVMTKFLDPPVKGQPHEFMKLKKGDRH